MFPLNKASVILSAFKYSSSPCKSVINSLASVFWASLSSGFSIWFFITSSISSLDKNVNTFKYSSTFSSDEFIKYWYNSYEDVLFLSSHSAFPSLLPNFFPVESKINGIVNAYAFFPNFLFINSIPVVILPHWSEPSTCIIQFFSWYKCIKSYPWRSV